MTDNEKQAATVERIIGRVLMPQEGHVMASTEEDNPGRAVWGWGMIAIAVFISGGGVGASGSHPNPALWWVSLVMFFITTFIASVVGAYYAGKKRR